jgi:co-chaperonin GroES (HSP10)
MKLGSKSYKTYKGKPRAVGDRVLVSDMYFGEQKTKSGLIINSDDGKVHGIYPRWGRVFSKGPRNKDDYEIGQWILVSHGRWTRGITVEFDDATHELRMIEAEAILAYSDEKPEDVIIGKEYDNGASVDTNFHADAMAS